MTRRVRRAHRCYGDSEAHTAWPVSYTHLDVYKRQLMILAHIAIKSFDLVASMTAGGPGYASDLPAMFMYAHTFTRGQMGLGAASAMLMLGAVLAILVPYLYSELRGKRHD